MSKYFRTSLLFSFFILFSVVATAQDFSAVNFDEIKANINDKKSDFYYPTLLERYQNGDESLTVEDYRHLYYGFTFQDAYSPLERYKLDASISDLMADLSEENVQKLRELSHQYLSAKPFNLKMINYLQNFNKNTTVTPEIEAENKKLATQYKGLINAILSTGNGENAENGFTVIHPSDEYMVLWNQGYKIKETKHGVDFDYFDVADKSGNVKEVYFDVNRLMLVGTKQMGIETLQVEDEQLPEDAVEVGSEEQVKLFVPLGYEILFQQQLDIDGDGDEDWVLVNNKEGEDYLSDFANNNIEERQFLVLLQGKDGLLEPVINSNTVVPCIDCGGNNEDPLQSITAEPKKITIQSKGGDLFIWERATTFEMDKKGKWYLTEQKFTSYRKGKESKKQTDVETKKDFGKVLLSDFNYYDLLD